MSTTASSPIENTDNRDEWVFTLYNNNKTSPSSKQTLTASHPSGSLSTRTSSSSKENDSDLDPETEGLLPTSSSSSIPSPCWSFASPFGHVLESSTLLTLHYRPDWQAIPDFTNSRGMLSGLLSCSCGSSQTAYHIQERYTSADIHHTESTTVVIRGMGACNALQVYLTPHTEDRTTLLESLQSEHQQGKYQSALDLHRSRFASSEKQETQQSQQHPPPRYTQPSDTLPKLSSSNQEEEYILLTFCLPVTTESHYDPPLLWKVQLPSSFASTTDSPDPSICLDALTVLEGTTEWGNEEPPTHIYIQGYQSWSYAGSIPKGQPPPQPALPDVFSKAFNHGGVVPTKYPTHVISKESNTSFQANLRGHPPKSSSLQSSFYQSSMFTCFSTCQEGELDEVGGPALLVGWLSQHEQLGIIEADEALTSVTMHAHHESLLSNDDTAILQTDWMYAQWVAPHLYDEEPMVHYLHAVAAYHETNPLQNGPLLTGWCSWYHYYEHISEENLRANFERLATMRSKVPTNVAVVDDGYMTAWGDWNSLKPDKFTDMAIVSKDIQKQNIRPGIWLAPYACDKHSQLVKIHPEWIIRNDQGRPANSSNCGKFFYGLDATNPQVRNYVYQCIKMAVKKWGYTVLKIDFLYAACLEGNGKYDLSLTRAQTMQLAMQSIRDAAGPNVFLIGCGCPIGGGIGYVDGMRISADTGPTWYPAFPLPWWDHGTLPALRAMIRNSMNRAPMGHRLWHNDPDCLLLGESTSLSDDEVASAASVVAMTCGMMLLSDDLTKVSIGRMRMLTKIFPMTGSSAIVLDLHNTGDSGLPSLMRLWCTDRYNLMDQFRQSGSFRRSLDDLDFNAEATHLARHASFSFGQPAPHPNERKRSCIHVTRGLGTWTLLSMSNWEDKRRLMTLPTAAISLPPETGWKSNDVKSLDSPKGTSNCPNGYHVFSFWGCKYTWLSAPQAMSGNSNGITNNNSGPTSITQSMAPHQTEVFHIREVTPNQPQYVGSDLHFSCGYEVRSFQTDGPHKVRIALKTELNRVGHVYLFLPTIDTSHVQVTVNGEKGRWNVISNVPRDGSPHCCGRVVRIMVVVHADGSTNDGQIVVTF